MQACSTVLICGLLVLQSPVVVIAETLDIQAEATTESSSGVIDSAPAVVEESEHLVGLDQGILADAVIDIVAVDPIILETIEQSQAAALDGIEPSPEKILSVIEDSLIVQQIAPDIANSVASDVTVIESEINISESVLPNSDVSASDSNSDIVSIIPLSQSDQIVETAPLGEPLVTTSATVSISHEEIIEDVAPAVVASTSTQTNSVVPVEPFTELVNGELEETNEDQPEELDPVDESPEPLPPDQEIIEDLDVEIAEVASIEISETPQQIQELQAYIASLPVMDIKQRRTVSVVDPTIDTLNTLPVINPPALQPAITAQLQGSRRTQATTA